VKHADLIRAALDGKKIQYRAVSGKSIRCSYPTVWKTFADTRLAVADMAAEYSNLEYRLEPKPDEVRYQAVVMTGGYTSLQAVQSVARRHKVPVSFEKRVFDGETGKLKSVEIV
jgi:hypothetical protein